MTTANTYLNFNGNCEEAFNFYKSVLGGDFGYVGRFKDMPPQEGAEPLSAEEGNKVMHVSLPISKETNLMGSDTPGHWADRFKQGNNFSVSLAVDSKEEAERLFNGLSAGGDVHMPLTKTFWSEAFGMFTDKFGINWMVSYENRPQQ